MSETEGGPPPGWPVAPAAPARAPAFEQPRDLDVPAFPPLDEGTLARGGRAAPAFTVDGPALDHGALDAPTAVWSASGKLAAATAAAPPVLLLGAEPTAALPNGAGAATNPAATNDLGGAPVLPLASPPVSPTVVETGDVASPVVVSARKSGARSRLAILVGVGIALVAGTGLGSFLYVRHLGAKSTDLPAKPALGSKKKKKPKVEVEKTHAPTAAPVESEGAVPAPGADSASGPDAADTSAPTDTAAPAPPGPKGGAAMPAPRIRPGQQLMRPRPPASTP